MLKLVLDPVNKLTDEEMRKGGKAKITLAEATTDSAADPKLDGITAEGTFKCFRAGTGVNACITARGNFNNANPAHFDKAKANAVLTMDLARKAIVPASESVAEFPGLVAASLDKVTTSAGEAGWLVDADHKDAGLKVTLGAPAEKATEVTVAVKDAVVANGHFVDPNCNHILKINPVGAVHIDACCQLKRLAGLKPNDHSFSIHVKDDPHAVVFEIVSADDFDPKATTAATTDEP